MALEQTVDFRVVILKCMQSRPHITIAICTYNRSGYLKDTLKDLAAQTARRDSYEILVVNNNSDDSTSSICDRFSQSNPDIRFRAVVELNQGLSHARNRAVKEALGEAIYFIDDDVYLPVDYVEKAVKYSKEKPNTLSAGGRIWVHFDDEEGQPNWIPGELMPMFGLHDLGDEDRIYPQSNFPRGGNMMVRKSVFDTFGLFDTNLGRTGKELLGSEEKAFFERIRKNGVQLRYWSGLELNHRIGNERLKTGFLKKQSAGIGKSERLRVKGSFKEFLKKLAAEEIKFAGSIILAIFYLFRLRPKAALFILRFRYWVMIGFLRG